MSKKKVYYKVVTQDRKSAFIRWSDGHKRLDPYILYYPQGEIVTAPNHVGIFTYSNYQAALDFQRSSYDMRILEVHGIGRPIRRKYINCQCRYDAFETYERFLKGFRKISTFTGMPIRVIDIEKSGHAKTVWFKAVEVLT